MSRMLPARALVAQSAMAAEARKERNGIRFFQPTPPQLAFLSDPRPIVLWRDGNQLGKANRHGSRVLTPTGWVPIEKLRVGDVVIAGDGTPTEVLGVYPQGEVDLYRVTFDDGAAVECCREHLWQVMDGEARFRKTSPRYRKWGVRSLGEILDRWGPRPKPKQRVTIPTPPPVQIESQPVPLDPYLLGVLLGDGCLGGTPIVTNPDAAVLGEVCMSLPPGSMVRPLKSGRCPAVRIRGVNGKNPVSVALRELGLKGLGSHERFVPDCYLWNSPDVRLAVLQGLLDTDGGVTAGCVEYMTTSRRLARNVRFLARSLGGKVKVKAKRTHYTKADGERVACRIGYRVRIRLPRTRLFRLNRKQQAIIDPVSTTDDRVLHKIEPAGRGLATCIRVAHPSHTFVTEDFIVTHNSLSLAAELVYAARGVHPYRRVKRAPTHTVVVGVSLDQMSALMKRIWQLVPKGELDPRCGFDPGRGFTGKPPRLVWKSGPGKGSVLNVATYKQGPQRVAGFTIDGVVMDEPPPKGMYGELVPRVMRQGGWIRIGMTPTPEMPDVTWLRKMVQQGQIPEHNFGLTPENTRPQGAPGPLMTQAQIEAYVAQYLPEQRLMRTFGDWEPVVTDRYIEAFTEAACVAPVDVAALRASAAEREDKLAFGVGLDHGTDIGKERAVLVAVEGGGGPRPRVWVLDEYVTDDATKPEDDAAAVLAMIDRAGIDYDDVTTWVGDIAAKARKRDAKKSNTEIRLELATLLGRDGSSVRFIQTPFKSAGSVEKGCAQINALCDRGHFTVAPRCVETIRAMKQFNGNPKDPLKDVLDALRYIAVRMIAPA